MTYKLITAPTEEPISRTEAKLQCRVDGTDEDTLIDALIVAAREMAEHETGRALCTQTRELVLDAFPESFKLDGGKTQSIVSIKYLDTTGTEQTLDPQDTLPDLDSEPAYISIGYGLAWPESYPVPNAVRVRYVCGYGAAADVPGAIKSWMLLAVGALYANREAFGSGQQFSLPDRFWHRLLDPYRIYEVC